MEAPLPESLVLRKRGPGGSAYAGYNRNPRELGILGRRNADARLAGKTRILGVRHDGSAMAFAVAEVREARLVEAEVGELPVVLAAPSDELPILSYDRRLDGRVLTFRLVDEDPALRDTETGTTWRLADGVAVDGPLAGRRLTRVAAHSAFWFGWQGFFPHSDVWHPSP